MRGARISRVRALALGTCAVCAGACASFASDGADVTAPPEAGAPADAAPEAPPADAGPDAVVRTCTLVSELDASFDDASTAGLEKHVGVGDAGALDLPALDADGGTGSLHGDLPADGSPSYYYRVVTPAAPDWCARLAFDVWYPSTPVGGLVAGPELHGAGPGSLGFQIDPSLDVDVGPDSPVTRIASGVSYQTWHHVVLAVQRLDGKTSYDVSFDGRSVPHVVVDQDVGASFELRLGVVAAAPGAHGELNLDDVRLEVGAFSP